MKEALERQDSAATFYLSGHIQDARKQYQTNWPVFQKWYSIEAHNITEPGEQNAADRIGIDYPHYRKAVERLIYSSPSESPKGQQPAQKPLMSPSQGKDYYFTKLEPAFTNIKYQVQLVLDINQKAIIDAKNKAELEAKYASWFCITAAMIAIALAIILTRRTVRFLVAPLNTLAMQAEAIGSGQLGKVTNIENPAEISMLAKSFNQMADSLLASRRIEEQRLHRAERMSYVALESLYDPVIITDASQTVVHINKAAELIFGKSDQAEKMPLEEVVKEQSIIAPITQVTKQGLPYDSEGNQSIIPLNNGVKDRYYRMRVAPMRDDDESLLGAVAVLEDITHLHELDRLKTEFISVASHELRTPVTSLLLSVDLLQSGVAGRLTSKQNRLIRAQRGDLERLQRLMRDLLDLTRLEAGANPPNKILVSLADIAKASVEGLKSQAQGKNITISIDSSYIEPYIFADRGQINRIINNLLDNALRHTNSEGHISVRIYPQDEMAIVSISDTGAGIPEDYLPRIFERFVQVPGATRGGSGLGLSMAAAIAKTHGGSIKAESRLGEGSTFTLLLPLVNKLENSYANISN